MIDATGALLYIGRTIAPDRRLNRHGNGKNWWPEVRTITIEHLPDHSTLVQAETRAIATERPRYNVLKPGVLDFICKFRVPQDKWNEFGESVRTQDTDRSKLVNAFIDWYMREPGAKLPQRPDAPPKDD